MRARSGEETKRPLLLLDVDGVLNPLAMTPPPGFSVQWIDGYEVAISARHQRWLNELAQSFDLAWATTWEQSANESIGPLLGLDELPVIRFDGERTGDTWKLEAVKAFVGDRSLVWIDDELYLDAYEWSRTRDAPTLLVCPSSSVGMTLGHFDQICQFRDELEA
ncbi:MAG: hypothetical protein KJN63_08270 [Acidimicrobiia bacterium]|nr:hypothetical protein [Acidimicrobiia bacterium]